MSYIKLHYIVPTTYYLVDLNTGKKKEKKEY